MSGRIALVSGCDANYYPLLREWLHSVQRFPESARLDICILDAGLSEAQVAELKPLVKTITRPDWPTSLPSKRTQGKEYLKACVCRPFLPKIFPGYDAYMWMDADTWVQDWSAVEMFLRGATERKDRIILTGAADRAYYRQTRIKWVWRWPYKVTSFYFSNARKPFGFKIAQLLLTRFNLSAGCFAMDANAPHWKRWQELAIRARPPGTKRRKVYVKRPRGATRPRREHRRTQRHASSSDTLIEMGFDTQFRCSGVVTSGTTAPVSKTTVFGSLCAVLQGGTSDKRAHEVSHLRLPVEVPVGTCSTMSIT